MQDVTPRPPNHRSPLLTGVLLILAGGVLLLVNLGYGVPPIVWDYWPLAFIALGLFGLVLPTRHLNRSGAVWLLALGAYCEISMLELFGLSWASAWPIFMIAMGLSTIFHSTERGGSGPRGDDKRSDKVLHET